MAERFREEGEFCFAAVCRGSLEGFTGGGGGADVVLSNMAEYFEDLQGKDKTLLASVGYYNSFKTFNEL